jgi:branched-subunit amino acid aminotransferase/4-amino-4-deoxychorismate lyase
MHPVTSINGQLDVPLHTGLSPFDRGFMLGDGVFETMKVANGAPWYLKRHLRRLEDGARRLRIIYPARLVTWIDDVIQRASSLNSDTDEMALRVTLTRGVALTPGLTSITSEQPTTVVTAYDLPSIPKTVYEQGISAQIASAPRNERALTSKIKTTNYAEAIIALQEARAAGYDEAIFLDTNNFVSEATSSNVFVCLNGTLVTPSSIHGILPGITRAVVLELAARLKVPVAERELGREELINADEAFLTSSLREIAPLVRVGNIKLGVGVPGPLTRRFMTAYKTATDRT